MHDRHLLTDLVLSIYLRTAEKLQEIRFTWLKNSKILMPHCLILGMALIEPYLLLVLYGAIGDWMMAA